MQTIVIIGFVVVMVQIFDRSAGETYASNIFGSDSLYYLILYSIITVASLAIQTFLLLTSSRLAFGTKSANKRSGNIIKFLYTASHITLIGFLAYLLGEQLITYKYRIQPLY